MNKEAISLLEASKQSLEALEIGQDFAELELLHRQAAYAGYPHKWSDVVEDIAAIKASQAALRVAIASYSTAIAEAESRASEQAEKQGTVGTLNITSYKGLGNYDFDYFGSLPDGTYSVYTTPPGGRQSEDCLTAAPVQEPDPCKEGTCDCCWTHLDEPAAPVQEPDYSICPTCGGMASDPIVPPAQRQSARSAWVGLTDEEIHDIYDQLAKQEPCGVAVTRRNVGRAIEAKLKEKNT